MVPDAPHKRFNALQLSNVASGVNSAPTTRRYIVYMYYTIQAVCRVPWLNVCADWVPRARAQTHARVNA